MSDDLIKIIATLLDDPRWGAVAEEALRFIDASPLNSQHSATQGQSSTAVAEMYKLRKKIGNIEDGTICGLDETIASLGEQDVEVRLGVIETDRGWVALWLVDDQNYPAGIMILKSKSPADPAASVRI
jgi:hypothetical protein